MFHSAGTGMDDQVPEPGGAVGVPVVGMKSHVPFSEASTRPSCGRDCGCVVRSPVAALAARAIPGTEANATATAPVRRTCRRLGPPFPRADIVVSLDLGRMTLTTLFNRLCTEVKGFGGTWGIALFWPPWHAYSGISAEKPGTDEGETPVHYA
jgi:hypothetical protein